MLQKRKMQYVLNLPNKQANASLRENEKLVQINERVFLLFLDFPNNFKNLRGLNLY